MPTVEWSATMRTRGRENLPRHAEPGPPVGQAHEDSVDLSAQLRDAVADDGAVRRARRRPGLVIHAKRAMPAGQIGGHRTPHVAHAYEADG